MGIETLEVWQLSLRLIDLVYALTRTFPREETYVLSSQMQRAALSIPSNLAEGRARNSRRDYARFISHAQGSTAELSTQLLIAQRLKYVSDTEQLCDLLDHIARKLNRLRASQLQSLGGSRTPNSKPRTPNSND